MNLLVKGVGAGIGLASEAIAHKKEKKHLGTQQGTSSQSRSRSTSPYPREKSEEAEDHDGSDSDEVVNDEEEWALDEAAAGLKPPPSYEESEARDASPGRVDFVVKSFLDRHPTDPSKLYRPIPAPVILPQRRPKDKTRGFIRAYAPVLGEYSGIDQDTFLEFLNDFDKASQASPFFQVVNVATRIAGFYPDPIVMAVTIAVEVASRTAQEVQTRHRTNTFLDQVNESLFKPRGLYCMIMTFEPDRPQDRVFSQNIMTNSIDATTLALARSTSPSDSKLAANMKNLKLSSGTTKGELALPDSAPLIYPAIDEAVAQVAETDQPLPEKKQNSLKSAGAFMSDYMDRRAQAVYAGSNPQSKLNTAPPTKQFASRYADPNHPANSGTLVALLTGGRFDPKGEKRQRRAARRARRMGIEPTEADLHNAKMGRKPFRTNKGLIRRVLQKKVLYLMITNLPSEAEMREVRQALQAEKENK